MRREERVAVQGPVKEYQPDGMSHRGSIEPPKTGGEGVQDKGSIDRTINQLLWTLAPKMFFSIENAQIPPPPPTTWQMMTFPNPLDALIPKIPFSFFVDFWVRVTSGAQGSVSVGFLGARPLSFFWWGARGPEGCIDPPSPPS